MKEVSVAILGAGSMGKKHARNLAAMEGVSVVGVSDADSHAAERFAASQEPHPRVFADFGSMYEQAKPDAVFICLPPFAHTTEVEEAAAHGIHVFMEKPIALTSSKALLMAEAVESANVVSQVGYMLRHSGAITRIKGLLESGAAGKPTLYRGFYNCNALHTEWWRDREKSGGQLFEQAIHIYDLGLLFLGEPASVGARMANLCHGDVEGYTVEDTSASVIQFKSGSIATIAATNCAIPGTWHHEFTLVCERLVATVIDGKELHITYTDEDPPRRVSHTFDDDPYLAEARSFIDSVRAGTQTATPIRTGYQGVRLVEAAVQSSSSGRFIEL
ncbi:MAG: Gfo/Idh/MocA family oxidoreductase [Spirochaetales bacterium]|nr:MAG: Gfo/Idh/MocA family oxidoreductase [Spirochaetales bacterium]